MAQLDIEKKIILELDGPKAAVLLDMIMVRMEEIREAQSTESIYKSIVLHDMGQQIVDQFVPKDQQESFMQKMLHQEEAMLNVLKNEGTMPE